MRLKIGWTYELNAPAKDGGVEVFIIGERAALQDLDRVNHGHATIEFPARDVVIHVLSCRM